MSNRRFGSTRIGDVSRATNSGGNQVYTEFRYTSDKSYDGMDIMGNLVNMAEDFVDRLNLRQSDKVNIILTFLSSDGVTQRHYSTGIVDRDEMSVKLSDMMLQSSENYDDSVDSTVTVTIKVFPTNPNVEDRRRRIRDFGRINFGDAVPAEQADSPSGAPGGVSLPEFGSGEFVTDIAIPEAVDELGLPLGLEADDEDDDPLGLFLGSFESAWTYDKELIRKILKAKRSVSYLENTDNLCVERSLLYSCASACWYHIQSKLDESSRSPDYSTGGYSICATTDWYAKWSAFVNTRLQTACVISPSMKAMLLGHSKRLVSITSFSNRTVGLLCSALRFICGVTDSTGYMRMADFPLYESALSIGIDVYDGCTNYTCVYRSSTTLDSGNLNCPLLKDGSHCHPIRTVKGLIGFSYFCRDCHVFYNRLDGHRTCPSFCRNCKTRQCNSHEIVSTALPEDDLGWITCDDCNFSFIGERCYDLHLRSICATRVKCHDSSCKGFNPKYYEDLEGGWEVNHHCCDSVCRNCDKMRFYSVESGGVTHRCTLSSVKLNDRKKPSRVCYFDFEATQERGFHEVTHAIAMFEDESTFNEFGVRSDGVGERKGDDMEDISYVVDEFCSWVFGFKANEGCTFVAHNGKGYDFQFILSWVLLNKGAVSKIIRAGSKILYMECCGVRFIDSISFLPFGLASFPKTFGLTELRKGFFPHLFNRRENFAYCGQFPPKSDYMSSTMTSSKGAEFDAWYDAQVAAGVLFDYQKDIVEYCRSDVVLLKEGFEAFRKSYIESSGGVDPVDSVTIAGACFKTFRTTFMSSKIYCLHIDEAQFIRRGFYGGRTNVMRAYRKLSPEEISAGYKIMYVDVMSLYPWVNKECKYPTGVPTLMPSDWVSHRVNRFGAKAVLESEIGFYEVDVTPPSDLLHPVLPEHTEGKLLFSLRKKTNQVYTSVELLKAVELGYIITKWHCSIVWPESTDKIFKNYVNTFLKIKQEASGWEGKMVGGEQVVSEESKREWCSTHKRRTGVDVSPSSTEKNPGRRLVAKLCLNSLWGKFAQSTNPVQTVFTSNDMEVYDILMTKKVNNITYLDESNGVFEVTFTVKKEDEEDTFTTNIAIAAFTTAYARLRLYEGLELVGDRALYCDTDSIIYVDRPDLPSIAIGDTLGSWTDELDGGDYITEFVSTGPKMYSYVTSSGKTGVRSKGFRCGRHSDHVLNFENFKKAVFSLKTNIADYNSIVTEPIQITRNKKRKRLENVVNFRKMFAPTINQKGMIDLETFRVYPFGYE